MQTAFEAKLVEFREQTGTPRKEWHHRETLWFEAVPEGGWVPSADTPPQRPPTSGNHGHTSAGACIVGWGDGEEREHRYPGQRDGESTRRRAASGNRLDLLGSILVRSKQLRFTVRAINRSSVKVVTDSTSEEQLIYLARIGNPRPSQVMFTTKMDSDETALVVLRPPPRLRVELTFNRSHSLALTTNSPVLLEAVALP